MTHEEKQIHNAVHAELREFEEFKALVRKMREAQKEQEIISARLMYVRERKGTLTDKDFLDVVFIMNKVVDLETEVDDYLKKIEK